ncbi:glycosyltransferase, probably involved in cell wall biogenesis [Rubidibacter lacunae KORDI 51-2]|uniref:Beta-monoglucosyldiacylglycerol synthase n=1 Tax=Rubidibacter lacunae KORDI 51-2 TaxID=582515 RepID=U5DEU9_9CHRO|nr:glycosyltransferase family 2 protein [Rubidibacter lacunae]ERN40116.1 glycosyltransferase, probably involved in cell wall biogenesis [Rubidibacter lacunae KORDI 51-2]
MPEPSWTERDRFDKLDPISSFLADWVDPTEDEDEFRSDFFDGMAGRRRKAAFALMMVWGTTISLHLVSWGIWVVLGATALAGVYLLQLALRRPRPLPEPLGTLDSDKVPSVSILVSARNEESVVGELVESLCNLDYPVDRYEVWLVNDRSTDGTGAVLDSLTRQYDRLQVLHRPAIAGGGKSGALNDALARTRGEIVAVFDADAQVPRNLLRRVVPLFLASERVGAVQVRKDIENEPLNFWTRGQWAEQALDAYWQQQRVAASGIGELRGNGQFVRRAALMRCGRWNEQTITDDLDLTLRLQLDDWEIDYLSDPPVGEEGVTRAIALWHQRNRWAEGGYQRYLDYWRLLARNRLGWRKSADLAVFAFLQYVLPTAVIPDTLMALWRHRLPLLAPLTSLSLLAIAWGTCAGVRRVRDKELNLRAILAILVRSLRGAIYMLHWTLVIPSMTARLSVRPKQLKWVKTVHQGTNEQQARSA